MNNSSVGNRGAHRTGAIAVVLAATLVALLAVFVLAKPSGAQVEVVGPVTLTVEVNPVEVDFGTVVVDDRVVGHIATRTITVTNNGPTPITIGGVELKTAAGEIAQDFSADLGPDGSLDIAAGGTATFEVSFDPSVEGTKDAVLTFTEGTVDGAIAEVIKLVNDAGTEVQGIDLSGTGDGQLPAGATPDCTKIGSPDGERLRGTPGNDVICALGGNDRVIALGGNDTVRGGPGKDRIFGKSGKDRLLGQAGNDRMVDKAGKDRLFGQGGRDTLITKDGKRGDLLVGGPKHDRVVKDKGDRARSI